MSELLHSEVLAWHFAVSWGYVFRVYALNLDGAAFLLCLFFPFPFSLGTSLTRSCLHVLRAAAFLRLCGRFKIITEETW
jgi:hypothetical protein